MSGENNQDPTPFPGPNNDQLRQCLNEATTQATALCPESFREGFGWKDQISPYKVPAQQYNPGMVTLGEPAESVTHRRNAFDFHTVFQIKEKNETGANVQVTNLAWGYLSHPGGYARTNTQEQVEDLIIWGADFLVSSWNRLSHILPVYRAWLVGDETRLGGWQAGKMGRLHIRGGRGRWRLGGAPCRNKISINKRRRKSK
jgi:hypothetical protein